jgi:large subunit ribosomal protein L3
MPSVCKPRDGSLGYSPKIRAKRIYPAITTYPESDKPKVLGFAGYKSAMLHAIVTDNRKTSLTSGLDVSVPVTVLDCPPLKVIGIRAYENTVNGFRVFTEAIAKELPKELNRKIKLADFKTEEKLAVIEKNLIKISKIRLIVATQPKLSGIEKKTPEIFELEIGGKGMKEILDFAKTLIGKEVKAGDVAKEGELVDVMAITKGKGTQGPVKRWGIKIQNRKAGTKRRHVGSLGQERPGKVRWTVAQAGQLGFSKRTELNKRILKIGEKGEEITPKQGFTRYGVIKDNYMLVEGSVPGGHKRLVLIRSPIRPQKLKFYLPEIKEIVK